MARGADLVIINRFGIWERDGRARAPDRAGARGRHSRDDRGFRRPLRRLDQVRGWQERQAPLRPPRA
ncbi:hypothetical protein QA640_19420 [Bradyrhizobium sp. CB82]|uniref:hypothetical protein n=1 Tax=Bradyrhizobium sp. CB82 TaxID=3039159 RepID=UPI0024B1E77D|nr:hypothetical protein [Bradyrhizobium sp. CB82]WFU44417.1 hypothetical protein QA640_19420 [Bradyrhizobium sp. CB82]